MNRIELLLTILLALVLLFSACGDDDNNPGDTPSATASPTEATVAPGEFPPGVIDLARTLDRALTNGDVDLSKWSRFSDFDCGFDIFPAPGPNCLQVAEGEGTEAIGIGALNSEGDVYTGPAYARYLADYTYDALPDESDEYGDGAARVYALADMPEEFEREQGVLGTYEIVTTRIGPPLVEGQEPKREVLMFHVTGTIQGWLITYVLRAQDPLLDPSSEESHSMFTAWSGWEEPHPTGGLAPRWPEHLRERQVAYLTLGGALYVASADGSSEPSLIADETCAPAASSKLPPTWSNEADLIAVRCGFDGGSGGSPFLQVYDPTDPGEPSVIESALSHVWAPRGHQVAYQTADVLLDEDGIPAVRIRDLDTGEDRFVSNDAILLDWPRQDELILGLNPQRQAGDVFIFPEYEAVLYSLDTGASERIERFDDNAQFWLHAPTNQALVLDGPSGRKAGGSTLAVYDLETGEETILEGLPIAYPSEGIPDSMVEIYPVDPRFVWADWDEGPGIAISEAFLDGSLATRLDRVLGTIHNLTPDGLVLYGTYDTVMTLLDAKTGATTTWDDAVMGAVAPGIVGGQS